MPPVILVAFTDFGAPKTGLTPTIRIRRLDTDALVVTDASMSEVGDGFYKYDFTGFDETIDDGYSIRCDGGSSLQDAERYAYASTGNLDLVTVIDDNLDDVKAKTDQLEFSVSGNVESAPLENLDDLALETTAQAIKTKTDNLPADPASEAAVIAEIDANETKIDDVQADVIVIDNNVDLVKAKTDKLGFDFSNNVNAKVNDAGVLNDITPGEVGDAVWDELFAAHFISGSFGRLVQEIDSTADAIKAKTDNLPADPTSETNATANKNALALDIDNNEDKIDGVQDTVDLVKGKTDNLPADPTSETTATANKDAVITEVNANETKIDAAQASLDAQDIQIAAIKAKTDNLPADPTSETVATANKQAILDAIDALDINTGAIADAVWDELFAGHVDVGSFGELVQDTDTAVDAVKVKTDNLPADPASNTQVTTSETNVIAEVDANEVKIDAVQSTANTIQGKTDNLPADPASESNATSNTGSVIAEVDANEVKIDAVDGKIDAQDIEIAAIKAKTDALPADPASETNATANKNDVIAEVDANEVKIDDIKDITDQIQFTVAGNVKSDPQAAILNYYIQTPNSINVMAFQETSVAAQIWISDTTGNFTMSTSMISVLGPYAIARYRGGVSTPIASGAPDVSDGAGSLLIEFDFDLSSNDFLPGDQLLIVFFPTTLVIGGKTYKLPQIGATVAITGSDIAAAGEVVSGTASEIVVDIDTQTDDLFNNMQVIVERDYPGQADYWVSRAVLDTGADDPVAGQTRLTLDAPLPFTPAAGLRVLLVARQASGAVATLEDKITRVLGLTHENVYVENTFDIDGNHTGSTVEVYDTPGNADVHDGTGLLDTYELEVTYDAGNPIEYVMKRVIP